MTKLIVAFSNFANAPKKLLKNSCLRNRRCKSSPCKQRRPLRLKTSFLRTYSIELNTFESSISFDVYLKILNAYLMRFKALTFIKSFNAGIKSLRATLHDEIFSGDFVS
jgi:hypothetical protein